MAKFLWDIRKYKDYIFYATKANLKTDVAGSYLGWLWWILDPLLFMVVYSFVALIVFGRGEQYFPLFVFIGLNLWNFFSRCLNHSVKLIKKYKGIIAKIYVPKYILVMIVMLENFVKMSISFFLVLIMMFLYKIHITHMVFNILLVFITLFVFTFGCSCLVLHAGVYITDLSKLIKVILKLIFYLSGVFYDIANRLPSPYNTYFLTFNPIAFLINAARDSLLYQTQVNYKFLILLNILGIFLVFLGIKVIQRYENDYVKVI